MLRVEEDNIESPYKIAPDIGLFGFIYKIVSVFVSLSIAPHGGRHDACCVTS